ncbi:hydroxymethylglutaryl-CoA synthase [Bacteroidia bacterium]|nr:hydroxymethylglutaryl-CoA synthase [Bacteroidia bacterium]MDC1395280.1 hydroxymethylglutaryl-CoA synthase [Bacteroidia bacterium]
MNNKLGIHDLAFQAPSLYLPIKDLAVARGIEAAKLKFGLGLESMSLCDVNEDVVTLATGAVLRLLKQNPDITPDQIGRIYVGTESSIDGSKPIGSYVHAIVNQYFSDQYSDENNLLHTDVLDMTFACIGAVDAMHNSLYYLQAEPEKLAIVVAADIANYDLDSTGEYTQGAGAVAMLLGANPRLIEIENKWGIAMKSEHDFFKPIRLKQEGDKTIELHDEKPIFDGQFSNETYQKRITEAWSHFKSENKLWVDYERIVFHLPYAFHGRRIITPLILNELKKGHLLEKICQANEIDPNAPDIIKSFSKTPEYKSWVKDKISAGEKLSSQMGNLYTASIFLGLMSSLEYSEPQKDDKLLFFAYGSGSKAKVFEGKLVDGFKAVMNKWQSKEVLSSRQEISFDDYIRIRTQKAHVPLSKTSKIQQISSGISETNRFERIYELKKNT